MKTVVVPISHRLVTDVEDLLDYATSLDGVVAALLDSTRGELRVAVSGAQAGPAYVRAALRAYVAA